MIEDEEQCTEGLDEDDESSCGCAEDDSEDGAEDVLLHQGPGRATSMSGTEDITYSIHAARDVVYYIGKLLHFKDSLKKDTRLSKRSGEFDLCVHF